MSKVFERAKLQQKCTVKTKSPPLNKSHRKNTSTMSSDLYGKDFLSDFDIIYY